MNFLISVLEWMDTQMKSPALYGGFHIFWLLLVVGATLLLCLNAQREGNRRACNIILTMAITAIVLEIYKQINYTFSYDGGVITASYQWYAFPWQFCSTPMYIGLLAGIFRKGKFHDCLCAYLSTYAVFAGLCVMVYPGDVFCSTVGINFQTMFCHGSMIVVGIYLLVSGHVKADHKTIFKALPIFASTIGIAMILNEVAFRTGLLETHSFNMFYISPYCPPHLPVYSLVQEAVPYPFSLIIYIAGFTAAGYLMLLGGMGVRKLALSARRQHTRPMTHCK